MQNIQSKFNKQLDEPFVKQKIDQDKNNNLFGYIAFSMLITGIVTGSIVYYWQKSVNQNEINDLRHEITALKDQVNKIENSVPTKPSKPTISVPTTSVPVNESESMTKTFSYNNFSFSYPDDWEFLDMSTDESFPLKSRLKPLEEKAIALNKNGLYLIITIDKGTDGESGGRFLDDAEYNDFISAKDKVVIQNSTFYLSKKHLDIDYLPQAEDGPWGWSALSECFPDMKTKSGKTFKGFSSIVRRNGYTYNIIIAGNEKGPTDPKLQGEIIDILKTIKW